MFFILFVTTILLDIVTSWNVARYEIELGGTTDGITAYCDKRETIDAFSLFISQFNLGKLLFAFIIIKMKCSDDIFNGTSKLDDIIKSSIFQKYKIESLSKRNLILAE